MRNFKNCCCIFIWIALCLFGGTDGKCEVSDQLQVAPMCPVIIGMNVTISCKKLSQNVSRWELTGKAEISWAGHLQPPFGNAVVTLHDTTEWYNLTLLNISTSNLTSKFTCHHANKCYTTKKLSTYEVALTLFGKTETSFTIRWTVDDLQLTTSYLEYKVHGNHGNWTRVVIPKHKAVFTVSDLLKETVYEYRVYSCYVGKCCNYTAVYTVQTKKGKGNHNTTIIIVVVGMSVAIAMVVIGIKTGCIKKVCERRSRTTLKNPTKPDETHVMLKMETTTST